jgi:predicted acyl esterase
MRQRGRSGGGSGTDLGGREKESALSSVFMDNEGLRGAGAGGVEGRRVAGPGGPAPAAALDQRFGAEVRSGEVVLRTDVYRPAGGLPSPVMIMRTPYGTARPILLQLARTLAAHGLAVVMQNVRGCHGSGGRFEPFADEIEDGEATLAWLDEQDWADGRVIVLGISYSTYTAAALCATARARRRPLCGIVSLAGMTDPYHHFYSGGALRVHWALPWHLLVRGGGERDPGLRELRRLALGDLAAAPEGCGAPASPWREWLVHPEPEDAYWRRRDVTGAVEDAGLPMLHVGGIYDFSLPSTLALYERMVGAAPAGSQRLVLGPWEHNELLAELVRSLRAGEGDEDEGGWWGLGGEVRSAVAGWLGGEGPGGVRGGGGPGAARGGGGPGAARRGGARVALGTAGGASEWRELEGWPPAARRRRWLLAPGTLAPAEGGPLPAADVDWVHDPDDPVPSVGGRCWRMAGWTSAGPLDQAAVEARADVLLFASAELAADLEVCGRGEALLRVAAPPRGGAADFCIKLVDLEPDGAARWVGDGIVRVPEAAPSADGADGGAGSRRVVAAAPGEGEEAPPPVIAAGPGEAGEAAGPGEAGEGPGLGERWMEVAIEIAGICHLFRRGHRLGLEVAASSFPQFDRTRVRGARRLSTGGARASRLELPEVFSERRRP